MKMIRIRRKKSDEIISSNLKKSLQNSKKKWMKVRKKAVGEKIKCKGYIGVKGDAISKRVCICSLNQFREMIDAHRKRCRLAVRGIPGDLIPTLPAWWLLILSGDSGADGFFWSFDFYRFEVMRAFIWKLKKIKKKRLPFDWVFVNKKCLQTKSRGEVWG